MRQSADGGRPRVLEGRWREGEVIAETRLPCPAPFTPPPARGASPSPQPPCPPSPPRLPPAAAATATAAATTTAASAPVRGAHRRGGYWRSAAATAVPYRSCVRRSGHRGPCGFALGSGDWVLGSGAGEVGVGRGKGGGGCALQQGGGLPSRPRTVRPHWESADRGAERRGAAWEAVRDPAVGGRGVAKAARGVGDVAACGPAGALRSHVACGDDKTARLVVIRRFVDCGRSLLDSLSTPLAHLRCVLMC